MECEEYSGSLPLARLGLLPDFGGELGFNHIPLLERLGIPVQHRMIFWKIVRCCTSLLGSCQESRRQIRSSSSFPYIYGIYMAQI